MFSGIMFSKMAFPARILEHLPAGVRWAQVEPEKSVLTLGYPELDAALPDGGLPRGAVVELSVRGGAALASSMALAACRTVHQQAELHGADVPWCAFVDPLGSLFAPALERAGVESTRLLVVRPPADALARVSSRLIESQAFAVVVVDTVGVPGVPLPVPLAHWSRVVRRLATGVAGSDTVVVLISDAEARRPLPWPVALRLELRRARFQEVSLRVTKDRQGRVGSWQTIAWSRAANPEFAPRSTRPPLDEVSLVDSSVPSVLLGAG